MPGAYKLIPPVDQDYPDHMKLIAVKNDPGISLRLDVVVDIDKAEDQVAKIVIGLLTVLLPHGVESIDQNCKIIAIKLDFHGKAPLYQIVADKIIL